MLNDRVKRYVLDFLVGKYSSLIREKTAIYRLENLIVYTNDPLEMKDAGIVIYRSDFFTYGSYGNLEAEPQLPLQQWRGIPILFGEAREEFINDGDTLVIYADIFASAYYLLSRYEELVHRKERDEFGRFPAELSLPVRAGFISRPIIDEYTEVIRSIIKERRLDERHGIALYEERNAFSKIYLTHNIHQPYSYKGLSGFRQAVFRDKINPFKALDLAFFHRSKDKVNSFHHLFLEDFKLIEDLPENLAKAIIFVKPKSSLPADKPSYSLRSYAMKKIISLAKLYKFSLGMYVPLATSLDPTRLKGNKSSLDKALKDNLLCSRCHLLAQGESEDLMSLHSVGIKHDFSMAYSEVGGFRLGTCRAVKFINPNLRALFEFTVHPITIVDTTLIEEQGKKRTYDEAKEYVEQMIRLVARHQGELCLVWHNHLYDRANHPWLGKLYHSVVAFIKDIVEEKQETEV